MNISQLETLIMISKTMSFRKAGELLNLTQPAVSAQIKSLEDEFKTILIDRNQPVTLTDRGAVFLEHAERILEVVEELRQKLYDLNENTAGSHCAGYHNIHRYSNFTARAFLLSGSVPSHQNLHSIHGFLNDLSAGGERTY